MEEDSAPAAKRARTEREEPSSKERSEEDCEQSGTGAGQQQVWPFRIIKVEWGISEYFSGNWLLFLTGSRY